MCGRFSLTTPLEMLIEVFGLPAPDFDLPPRYNIAPTQPVAAVLGGPRRLEMLRWGLVPPWADDPAIGSRMINARAETLRDKPSFRAPLRHRRCLVLADGFFEWSHQGRSRIPHHIRLDDAAPMAFAGLWERWQRPGRAPITSCTIITTAANEVVAPIHDRMPVILDARGCDRWLADDEPGAAQLAALLVPRPARGMVAVQVSSRVNSVAHDDPGCTDPVPVQQDLVDLARRS